MADLDLKSRIRNIIDWIFILLLCVGIIASLVFLLTIPIARNIIVLIFIGGICFGLGCSLKEMIERYKK